MKTLLLVLIALAASPALAEEPKVLSAELLWQIERLGAPVISPAGGHIVAPVTSYDTETDESETRLWLFSASGGVQRALSVTGQSAGNPVFSPDGTRLAFTAKRADDEATQIYLLPMDGPGEAQRLSEVPTGVSALKWVGEHLYFISRVWPEMSWEEMAEEVENKAEQKVSAHEWNALPYAHWDSWIEEAREAHLFRIPAAGGDIEALTQATGLQLPRRTQDTGSYDVHPAESHVAFVSDARSDGVAPDFDVFLARVGASSAENLTADNEAGDGAPMFSPDGRTLAYTRQAIVGFYADTANIVLHDLASGEQREITSDWDRSASGLVWAPDSSGFFAAVDDAATSRVHFIAVDGSTPRRLTQDTDFGNLSIARDGTLVATNQSFLYPARLVRVDTKSGDFTRLDTLNDALLADVELGTYESVTFEGHDGADIQMWVHYPPGFDPERRYPLFLLIHGGPHGAITDSFHYRWNAQTFASWGYVTAWHNFHGSSGFGQDFVDYINPDWITAPYNDTIAAANWFAGQDWIDSERMVAGGGSYGGYLSTILLGRDHPFRSLLIHAPVYNMYSQMASDFAVHSERFGQYWDVPEIYREISPHYYAGSFDTPALIVHGQLDYRVPVGQAFELFRTLQSRRIESRLLYYPDENHWILKPNNSIHWYRQVRDWQARFAAPGPSAAQTQSERRRR